MELPLTYQMNKHELILSARNGDRKSLEKLLRMEFPFLKRHVDSRLSDQLMWRGISCDDVVQETLFCAFRDIESLQHPQAFSSWLLTISDRCIFEASRKLNQKKNGGGKTEVRIDDFRSSCIELAAAIGADSESPSKNAAKNEWCEELQIALAMLPEDQREVIKLQYFEQLSLKEIAELLDRSVGSVRGLLQRAKDALRNSLERPSKWRD